MNVSANRILNAEWPLWLLFFITLLFILWIFFGGGDYEYIGLSPLKVGVDSNKYINEATYCKIERDNHHAVRYSDNTKETNNNNLFDQEIIKRALGKYKPYKNNKISKGERLCKEVIEEIYGKPFYCIRPDFLKNPETKRNLELDLYNDELKIAVERNGAQHVKWPNYTGMSHEQFINQVRRDIFKVETCDANGIYLITVPHTVPNDKHKIKEYIIDRLPENNKICYIDSHDSYDNSYSNSYDSDSYDGSYDSD